MNEINQMSYFWKTKKIKVKIEFVSTPEWPIDEAVFSNSKSYFPEKRPISNESKHKGVQTHNEYTLEVYLKVLEKNGLNYGFNHSLGVRKHEISILKRAKVALITFDDERFLLILIFLKVLRGVVVNRMLKLIFWPVKRNSSFSKTYI